MKVPYQPELLFKQGHALLHWVLSLHRKTTSFLHQQTSLFLVLGIPQQPCFLVTCWTAMAAAARSKDCSLSVATSVRGTSWPLYLLSLSSHFSHHFQFCKGFSYLFIPLCSFFVSFFFLFCWGGRLFKHPTAMQVSRYLRLCSICSSRILAKQTSNIFFKYFLQNGDPDLPHHKATCFYIPLVNNSQSPNSILIVNRLWCTNKGCQSKKSILLCIWK